MGSRFIDNGDGTITDTQTQLTWEKKLAGSGCLHCVEDFYPWEPGVATSGMRSAFDWLSVVNSEPGAVHAGLGGQSDWRLPSRDELWTLVDCSFGTTCIDPTFGPTSTDAPYWTFTTLGDQPTYAWEKGFYLGLAYDSPKNFNGVVRAVRGGVPVQVPGGSPPRYIDNSDGTVTDTQTGLMWEKKVSGSSCPHCVNDRYAWEPGLATSANPSMWDWLSYLNGYFTGIGPAQPGFAGYSDWRIPSRDELSSLVDCSNSPCVDPVLGPAGTVVPYWTSTSLGQNETHAWLIGFGSGLVYDGAKNGTAFARAVRGGVILVGPSWTPTPTRTPVTPSPTPPPTFTRSPTATFTNTLPPTSTPTATLTYTATPTPTPTVTPLPTSSETATLTPTATATSTLTPSQTATQTSTATPRVVRINIGTQVGRPGETIPMVVSIATAGRVVAGTGNDITFNTPQLGLDPGSCHANPALGKALVASVVSSDGATETVRVFIQSGVNAAAIPDGTLYTCEIQIAPSTLPGDYTLLSVNSVAFSDTGTQIDLVAGSNGLVVVSLVAQTNTPTMTGTSGPSETATSVAPTATTTQTPNPATQTVSPDPTETTAPSNTPTSTGMATQTSAPATETETPARPTTSATATETPSPASTATATHILCVGDCRGIGAVGISDVIIGVNIVLGNLPASVCPAFDTTRGPIHIDQLITAVNNALNGCKLG